MCSFANLDPNLDLYLDPNFGQMFMNKKCFLKFNAIWSCFFNSSLFLFSFFFFLLKCPVTSLFIYKKSFLMPFNAYCGREKIKIWVNIQKTHRRLNLTPRSLIKYLYIGRVLKTCSTCLDLYIHYILVLRIFICVYTLFFTRTLHRILDFVRVSSFYKVTVRRPREFKNLVLIAMSSQKNRNTNDRKSNVDTYEIL
jgi:hypothetical protein